LGLQFLVGHAHGIADDYAEVSLGNFVGRGVAVGRRRVYDKGSACRVPFLCLVLLFGILGLDVVQLLTLELVLILCFLRGARDARCEGPEDGGGVL
jgi:hypothetical protein